MSETVDEMKNCISKNTGRAYMLYISESGKASVVTYEGEEVESFGSLRQVKDDYIVF